MSTRASIHVIWNNDNHKILYQHHDGYPSWLGNRLLSFVANQLNTNEDYQKFLSQLDEVQWVKEDGKPDKESADHYINLSKELSKDPNYLNLSKQLSVDRFSAIKTMGEERMREEWYALLRDFQGIDNLIAIFANIVDHAVCCDQDHGDIQYSYHLNMDTMSLWVFKVEGEDYKEVAHIEFEQAGNFRFQEEE